MAPAARWAEHRADLLHAAAEEVIASASSALSVDRVVKRAGRGRNTFYAHFRDVDQVLRAVESSVLSRVAAHVEAALGEKRDVRERLSALASAWLDVADANPTAFRAMMLVSAPQGRVLSRACELLRQGLRRVVDDAHDRGAISAPVDDLTIALLAGAWDGALRAHVEQRHSRESIVQSIVELSSRMFD